jgi:hypothetical protein
MNQAHILIMHHHSEIRPLSIKPQSFHLSKVDVRASTLDASRRRACGALSSGGAECKLRETWRARALASSASTRGARGAVVGEARCAVADDCKK